MIWCQLTGEINPPHLELQHQQSGRPIPIATADSPQVMVLVKQKSANRASSILLKIGAQLLLFWLP